MAVRKNNKVVIVGLGEVGKPLLDLVSEHHDAVGVDARKWRRAATGTSALTP